MRPVNKGDSPYQKIKSYGDALPYLEKRLGIYCSFCEMRINHVPEVEHVASKTRGGDLTAWNNLLLGCKYCNSRKSNKTSSEDVNEYLWPDQDNTALAYSYEKVIPEIAQRKLAELDSNAEFYNKAKRLFDLVGLGHVPTGKANDYKDRRFQDRNEAYQMAKESLKDWLLVKTTPNESTEAFKRQLVRTVQSKGFFSIWMTVFSDEPEILKEILEIFPGTQKRYFDENGHVKQILRL